jgi:acyl carrier protein
MRFILDNVAVFGKIKELMISNFGIDAASISLEKRLNDDLKLDSLDMVDLILGLSDYIGKKIDPTLFKDAGTVQDLVNSVSPVWKSK